MAAYGLGGLFQGFTEGMRLAEQQKDAEERRGLMKAERAKIDADTAARKREEDYAAEKKAYYEKVQRESQGGVSGEVVDSQGTPLGVRNFYGTDRPEAQGLEFMRQPTQLAPRDPMKDPAYAEEIIRGDQLIALKHNKMDYAKAIDGVRLYDELKKRKGWEAASELLTTGDKGKFFENAKSAGINFPAGTDVVFTQEPIFPGIPDGPKMRSFNIVGPDGNVVGNYGQMLRATMSPKDVLSNEHDVGKTIMEHTWRTNTIAESKRHAEEIERLRGLELGAQKAHYETILEKMQQHSTQLAEQIGIAKDVRAQTALQNTLATGQKQIFQLSGFQPIKGEALAAMLPKDKEAHLESLKLAGLAQSIFEANVDINNKKVNTTPSVAVDIAKTLLDPAREAAFIKEVKTDDDGLSYVTRNGNKVFVPPPAPAPGTAAGKPEEKKDATKKSGSSLFGIVGSPAASRSMASNVDTLAIARSPEFKALKAKYDEDYALLADERRAANRSNDTARITEVERKIKALSDSFTEQRNQMFSGK